MRNDLKQLVKQQQTLGIMLMQKHILKEVVKRRGVYNDEFTAKEISDITTIAKHRALKEVV